MADIEAATAQPRATTFGQNVLTFGVIVGVLLLVYLALAWAWDGIFGGGIFSLFGAIGDARSGAARIELDRDALTTLTLVPVGLLAFGIAFLGEPMFRRLGIESGGSHQWVGTTVGVIAFLLVCGFSSLLSEKLVTAILTSRHYARCEPLDRHTGSGKGAVYYHMFVLHPSDCPAAR